MADQTGLQKALPLNHQMVDNSSCIADYAMQRTQEMAGKTPDSCQIQASMTKKPGKSMPAVKSAPSRSPARMKR